jgi:UDP-3-O-[3-hydroxymyristoyl] glucosamine N-acyltransferase
MQKITCQQIKDQFPEFFPSVTGPLTNAISRISALENIQPESLIFILHERFMDQALKSPASLVLAPLNLQTKVNPPPHQTWLFSRNPELGMNKIKIHYFMKTPYRTPFSIKIHPSAIIDKTASLDPSVVVGPGAYIGANVKIGAHSFVGTNSVVEENVTIGENTTLHPLSYIGHSCIIGNRCEVLPQACIGSEGYGYAHDEKGNHYRIPHSGKVILHDDVHVGAATCIDRGTIEDSIIGQGTKIDNQCHLAHNSIIGKNGLITAQFGMAGSTTIGDNFITGGKTSVTGHISIANNVGIAGMSGVTKSIEEPGQYGGFPLQKMQDYLKTKAAMANLSEMRKQLSALIKNKK